MPKFAANLSMMYQEHPFMERFGAAARDGFTGVEYLFPYPFAAADLKAQLEQHGLQQVLFNAPPGNWEQGERGLACLPGREAMFRDGIELALDYARVLGNTRLHVMAGLRTPGQDPQQQHALYVANLAWAAQQARAAGITIVIEPINQRDMPGYFLSHQAQAHALCREIGADNLQVLFDLYHCQITEGDLSQRMRQHLAGIGHMQIAGVPGRHEPDVGEIHYPSLFALMDELGYAGWVGCEYRPKGATSAGLGWRNNLKLPD